MRFGWSSLEAWLAIVYEREDRMDVPQSMNVNIGHSRQFAECDRVGPKILGLGRFSCMRSEDGRLDTLRHLKLVQRCDC